MTYQTLHIDICEASSGLQPMTYPHHPDWTLQVTGGRVPYLEWLEGELSRLRESRVRCEIFQYEVEAGEGKALRVYLARERP